MKCKDEMLGRMTDSLEDFYFIVVWHMAAYRFRKYKSWKTCHRSTGMHRPKQGQSRAFKPVIANVWLWHCRRKKNKNTSCDKTVMLRGASNDPTVGKQWHVLGKESCKRMCDSNSEGWRGAQIGHKKTHSFERTHVLDSKVTLTHHERNDAGREWREEGRKSEKRSEGKEKNTFLQG